MKPFFFRITARHELVEQVTLDLHPGPVDGYKNGLLAGTGEWNRALTLQALKTEAPELYEELRTIPIGSQFVFALLEKE